MAGRAKKTAPSGEKYKTDKNKKRLTAGTTYINPSIHSQPSISSFSPRYERATSLSLSRYTVDHYLSFPLTDGGSMDGLNTLHERAHPNRHTTFPCLPGNYFSPYQGAIIPCFVSLMDYLSDPSVPRQALVLRNPRTRRNRTQSSQEPIRSLAGFWEIRQETMQK